MCPRITIEPYGISIFGSPYASYDSLNPRFKRYHETEQELYQRWKSTLELDPKIDILVTHAPAFGTLDEGGLGSKVIQSAVEQLSPTLHAFGHIHSSFGVHRQLGSKGNTITSINASSVGENNKVLSNQPVVEVINKTNP